MITSIEVKQNKKSREKDILLTKRFDFCLMPRINFVPIIGTNGCGKSTLLKAISTGGRDVCGRQVLDIKINKPTDRYVYLNSKDNLKIKQPKNIFGDLTFEEFGDKFYASRLSEGMGMMYSYMPLLEGLLYRNIPEDNDKDISVILDEFDSGLSIDNIDKVMNLLVDIVTTRKDVQIIFSFNNSYILKYLNYCNNTLLSMYSGKPVCIKTDAGLLRFYRRKDNMKKFNKRRYDEDGEYIIG